MTHNIMTRIEKLELKMPSQPTDLGNYLRNLLKYSIAYYLGNFSAEEELMQAYARALGYADRFEFFSDRECKVVRYFERELLALDQLFAKFSVIRSAETDRNDEKCLMLSRALDQMVAGLPETLRQRLPPDPWFAKATDRVRRRNQCG